MIASHNGHKEVAVVLLEKKASVDMQNQNGRFVALYIASQNGHKEAAALNKAGEEGERVYAKSERGRARA